jgi:hypothetical protein
MGIRNFAKRVPLLGSIYKSLRSKYLAYRQKKKSTEEIFTDIYVQNTWAGKESVSGTGSDIDQVAVVIQQLPVLFASHGIKTMLDIPCGDFNWMKRVSLDGVDYVGADIVADLIATNKKQHERTGIRFEKLNLITDELPKVDLIFCRDCFIHLSFNDIFRALHNICDSQSLYLLTTTFVERRFNQDIPTGEWRPVNLAIAPFTLPPPLALINEGCTEEQGAYKDKTLGLWKIDDLRQSLAMRNRGSITAQG